MPIEITVPRLGWSMEEGVFAGWLKAEGDAVSIGEPVFALESEKVTMEVEALDNGILHIAADAPAADSTVIVGQRLGYILQNGEAPPATEQPRFASPRARSTARELGIDIASVQPREGAKRIIEADVLQAKQPKPRTTLARRMEESFRAPHFYLHADANVEILARLRHQHRPAAYNDFLIKAIAIALVRHPRVNAYWEDGAIVPRSTQHIALAAQIGDTLYTPVIANPAEKSLGPRLDVHGRAC